MGLMELYVSGIGSLAFTQKLFEKETALVFSLELIFKMTWVA